MRVALDVRRMQDRPLFGVGRILANLVPLLAEAVDLDLLSDARRPPPPVPAGLAVHPLWRPPGTPETLWLQWSAPRWLHGFPGLFHATFNGLPYRLPVPAVVTIHDLSFEHHPEGFRPGRRRAFQLQARHAARVARRVITVTEHTKADLVARYGLDPSRVLVAPNAVDHVFRPDAAAGAGEVLARLGVDAPYAVALGGQARRGLPVAVEAWRRVRRAGGEVCLVVVGHEPPAPEPGLAWAGSLPDREWAAVLAGAAAFCYPTRFEGFGMPALEAAASGTPVVCAPVGPLPEVLGDAAEWCDAPDVDAIAAGLARVLADPARAARLRETGLARAAGWPTWADAARVHARAYEESLRD